MVDRIDAGVRPTQRHTLAGTRTLQPEHHEIKTTGGPVLSKPHLGPAVRVTIGSDTPGHSEFKNPLPGTPRVPLIRFR